MSSTTSALCVMLLAFWLGYPVQPVEAQRAANGSIGGVVLAAESGSPLRARVWLVGAARPKPPNSRGTFRFDALVPGRYHLRATLLGYAPVDTTVRVASGQHVEILVRLHALPTEISALTIHEVALPKPAPAPAKPKIICTHILILGPTLVLCVTPQMLTRTTVKQQRTFLGSFTHGVQAAQRSATRLGFTIERQFALDDRTWLITARRVYEPADTSAVRLEVQDAGPNDITVRVTMNTVSWRKSEIADRANVLIQAVKQALR